MEDLREVRDRLTALEVQSEERWKSHKSESELIWGVINDKLDLLLDHRDDQEKRQDKCHKKATVYTDTAVQRVLKVPLVLSSIFGSIWAAIRLHKWWLG